MAAQEDKVVVVNPTKSAVQTAPEPAISTHQLLELFTKMNAENAQLLAKAIVDAQKPYEDPAKKANDEKFKAMDRAQMEQQRLNRIADQKACPHIAGCNPLSEEMHPSGKTAIIKHRLDSSETIGICTNCQRVWRENDPDYGEWMRKPSFNRNSMSGDRQFRDPARAREAGRS